MSEERIKERCKREDIALKIIKGFLKKDCYTDTELNYSLNTLLDLYNKQQKKIQQKDIMNEALKNAIGNILQGKKLCKEIKGGTTIRINLIKEKEKRIKNALLYLKTMEETEDTYELEKILKGE